MISACNPRNVVTLPPVISIDGPSASGKGTVAQAVASELGFHYLDSGALYRMVGLAVIHAGGDLESESQVISILLKINIKFSNGSVFLDGEEVAEAIREEPVSVAASKVGAHAAVRQALLARQRAFREKPGLVADGRDMGSVVFPDSTLKIFLTASVEARAERRYKQLIGKGLSANMAALLQELRLRDQRDSERAVAPLQKCPDAVEVDTTNLSVNESIARVLACYRQRAEAAG
jgi:cytidylate kinase